LPHQPFLTLSQTYLQSDLNLFFADVATNVPVGYAPTMDSIDGGVANFYYPNGQDESDLDLEYAIALGTAVP
jgi:tripeptidyl-peptidase-1